MQLAEGRVTADQIPPPVELGPVTGVGQEDAPEIPAATEGEPRDREFEAEDTAPAPPA